MKRLLSTLLVMFLALSVSADDIAVTVYNKEIGVVSENRTIEFDKGINKTSITDIPARIDPGSVRFEILNNRAGISILEQDYAYDLINPEKIFAKYIDKKIEIIDTDGQLHSGILAAPRDSPFTVNKRHERQCDIHL